VLRLSLMELWRRTAFSLLLTKTLLCYLIENLEQSLAIGMETGYNYGEYSEINDVRDWVRYLKWVEEKLKEAR